MPDPITAYSTVKFLWNESKPVRNWLWSKLPFARDQKKREEAEGHLATLLEDANRLARNLQADAADKAIDQRIDQFRSDLLLAKIPEDQAETLVERGAMFVKLLVTGPMGETAVLRERVHEMALAQHEIEGTVAQLEERVSKLSTRNSELELSIRKSMGLLRNCLAGAAVLLGLAIAFLVFRGTLWRL